MQYRWFGFSTNLTDEGYQVIVTRNITDEDVPGRYLDQWTKYFYMCIDWNLKRETVNGVIIIYDMATTNKNEVLTQVTPNFLRKSLQCSVSIIQGIRTIFKDIRCGQCKRTLSFSNTWLIKKNVKVYKL